MRDCHPARVGCQFRRRLHHGHVDRVRALGAAKDQNPRRPRGADSGSDMFGHEFGTYRIACDNGPPSEIGRRRFECHGCRADDAREQSIRQAGNRILFEQQRGNSSQDRHRHDGAGAVAADADHEMRRPSREIDQASRPLSGIRSMPRTRAAIDVPFNPALRSVSSSKPSLGITRDFDTPRRPGKRDARIRMAPQQLACHRNSRIEVAPRATARDQDAQRTHASCIGIVVVTTCVDEACCDTFSRIPIPRRLMSSDDPP